MKTGLFLPALVSLGPYVAGAVQALINEGRLKFDVVGASSGAVIPGAFVATGQIDRLVDLWQVWENRDIMGIDWRTLFKGALLWSPSFMTNQPEFQTGIDKYIAEAKLLPGVRFRFHVANLSTGEEEVLEYPGASMPFQTALHAAVAVPVMFSAVEYKGMQLADGATLNGSPLEKLMLCTDVERVFIVGVAPQVPLVHPARNALNTLQTALEWNQFSEELISLEQANELNMLLQVWETDRRMVEQIVKDLAPELLSEVHRRYHETAFLPERAPIEIISVFPQQKLEGLFGDFKPAYSRLLLERGRQDALQILERIG